MPQRARFFAHLAADHRGVSVIELALVMPLLSAMILTALDISMAFNSKLLLQTAAERTVGLAYAGGLNGTAYDNLAAEAAAAAGVPASNVTVTKSLECNNVLQPSTTTPCPTGQQVGRFVTVTITSAYAPMFPQLIAAIRPGGQAGLALSATASVRLQ